MSARPPPSPEPKPTGKNTTPTKQPFQRYDLESNPFSRCGGRGVPASLREFSETLCPANRTPQRTWRGHWAACWQEEAEVALAPHYFRSGKFLAELP